MRKWIKLYTEILDDHKMESMSDHLFRVAVKLFAVAGRVDKDGLLGTLEQVALYLRQDDKTTLKDMQELEKVRVTCNKNGIWRLKNFKDRNGKSPSEFRTAVNERVKKHRENKSKTLEVKRESNESVTAFQSTGNEGETPLDKIRIEEIRDMGAKNTAPTHPELTALADLFSELTHLPKPDWPNLTPKQKSAAAVRWANPLREFIKLANSQSADVMREAIRRQRADKIDISAPQSIEKKFQAVYSERHSKIVSNTPEL